MRARIVIAGLVAVGVLGSAWLAATPPAGIAVDVDAWRSIGRKWFRGGDAPLRAGLVVSKRFQDCASCHADIAEEWRRSLHSQSWSDPLFQKAYAVEPEAYCRHCHAPAAQGARVEGFAASDGVSCTVCHVRDGTIWGSRARAADAAGHAVAATPDLQSAGFCGGCHQFGFLAQPQRPRVARFETVDPQQDTFAEWAASRHAAAGLDCRACHMPLRSAAHGKVRRSHAFVGTTPELIRAAVNIAGAAIVAADRVDMLFCLQTNLAGHAFPTGDLFRRAVLRTWVTEAPQAVREYALARVFGPAIGDDPHRGPWHGKRAVEDRRVLPDRVREVELSVAATGTEVQWQLFYDKMPTPDPQLAGMDPPQWRVLVAAGRFAPVADKALADLQCSALLAVPTEAR